MKNGEVWFAPETRNSVWFHRLFMIYSCLWAITFQHLAHHKVIEKIWSIYSTKDANKCSGCKLGILNQEDQKLKRNQEACHSDCEKTMVYMLVSKVRQNGVVSNLQSFKWPAGKDSFDCKTTSDSFANDPTFCLFLFCELTNHFPGDLVTSRAHPRSFLVFLQIQGCTDKTPDVCDGIPAFICVLKSWLSDIFSSSQIIKMHFSRIPLECSVNLLCDSCCFCHFEGVFNMVSVMSTPCILCFTSNANELLHGF